LNYFYGYVVLNIL